MTAVESTIPRTDTDFTFLGDVKEDVEKGIDLLLAHFAVAGQAALSTKDGYLSSVWDYGPE